MRFEVGKRYGAFGDDFAPITVLRRTAKYIVVLNGYGNEQRMLIREDAGIEYVEDSSVPEKWRSLCAWSASFEVKGG